MDYNAGITIIEVHIYPSNDTPAGIGELGFPSVCPALCNAIYDACKIRVRRLPIKHTSLLTSIEPDDDKSQSRMNIYPNPYDSFINVELTINESEYGVCEYNIFDILGNNVFSIKKNYIQANIKEQLNLSHLISGAYIFSIKLGNNKIMTSKLLK